MLSAATQKSRHEVEVDAFVDEVGFILVILMRASKYLPREVKESTQMHIVFLRCFYNGLHAGFYMFRPQKEKSRGSDLYHVIKSETSIHFFSSNISRS
jgi:hypothetical protein